MSMWEDQDVEQRIRTILAEVHFHQPEHHFGRPFLTAYQLAIAFREQYRAAFDAIDLPVGGEGVGQRSTLAQYLARELSRRIANGSVEDIEGAFISNDNLADISFRNGEQILRSSLTDTQWDLSMFRLRVCYEL